MADKFPINNDIDYIHTIKDATGALVDLTAYDWYGIHWFYRTSQGKKVEIGKYTIATKTGYTTDLEATDAANGQVTSHLQRAHLAIPAGVRIYWQPYVQVADAEHDTNFHGTGCEVEAGVSCDADLTA